MEGARQKLKLALDKTTFQDARVPIYQNATATAETDAEAIKNNLDLQLTNPVRWIECVEGMITGGASEMYELGPSKVLTGLVRRIDRSVTPTPLGTLDQLSS